MNSLEIFSGAGGLAKGLEIAGFSHAAFVEFNKHACQSLAKNFESQKVFCGDVRDYDFASLSDIDLVAGGPPCQPFSMGGKHQANADSRDMFPYAINAIAALRPKAFVFENVKGLLRASFSEYFDYVLLRLAFPHFSIEPDESWQAHLKKLRNKALHEPDSAQYHVSYKLLNAADYGVPQCRERVVIVGIRSDLQCKWRFPLPTHSSEQLVFEKYVSGAYWKRHGVAPIDAIASAHIAVQRATQVEAQPDLFAPKLAAWRTVRDALVGVCDPREHHSIAGHEFRHGARSYQGHTGGGLDQPAKNDKGRRSRRTRWREHDCVPGWHGQVLYDLRGEAHSDFSRRLRY